MNNKPFTIAQHDATAWAVVGPFGTVCLTYSGYGLTAEGNAQRIADMFNREFESASV